MTGQPTDLLRDEHRIILRALEALEAAAARLARGVAPPAGWWERCVDWLATFADRNHHAKEEHSLFPAMEKAGVPSEGGPIGRMLEEHVQGRALVRAMRDGTPEARVAAAREYVDLLRAHIDKENEILFPLAEAVLSEPAVAAVRRDFDAVAAEQGAAASLDGGEAAVAALLRELEHGR